MSAPAIQEKLGINSPIFIESAFNSGWAEYRIHGETLKSWLIESVERPDAWQRYRALKSDLTFVRFPGDNSEGHRGVRGQAYTEKTRAEKIQRGVDLQAFWAMQSEIKKRLSNMPFSEIGAEEKVKQIAEILGLTGAP